MSVGKIAATAAGTVVMTAVIFAMIAETTGATAGRTVAMIATTAATAVVIKQATNTDFETPAFGPAFCFLAGRPPPSLPANR